MNYFGVHKLILIKQNLYNKDHIQVIWESLGTDVGGSILYKPPFKLKSGEVVIFAQYLGYNEEEVYIYIYIFGIAGRKS